MFKVRSLGSKNKLIYFVLLSLNCTFALFFSIDKQTDNKKRWTNLVIRWD